MKYILITPARNEQAFIDKTLASMVEQTQSPERWVIVDDGSTDRTAEIVQSYLARFPWIELVRQPNRPDRSFTGKAVAVNAALERLASLRFDVVGNLDAIVVDLPPATEEWLAVRDRLRRGATE